MLPATITMEDESCRMRQHQALAPPASTVRVIKATDFSIAAIIGSGNSNNSKPSSPESAGITQPMPLLFNFGKFIDWFI